MSHREVLPAKLDLQRFGGANGLAIAVVIPSFRARATIGNVLRGIGPEVRLIYVVDDGCPEATGEQALREWPDARLKVLHNSRNLGVGGAMKQGYRRALEDGADIVVKLDADGQMDPSHIPRLIAPIANGTADYAKGNRFAPVARMPLGSCPRALAAMPRSRRFANRAFSIIHRALTGYMHIQDPANGYTAIHSKALRQVRMSELADCFFFETDMLFRLNLAGAIVLDVPLPALYPAGIKSVSLIRVAPRFGRLIATRCLQRLRFRRAMSGQPISPEPLWCRTGG